MHRFKLWVLKCWFWSVYTSNFFTIHERDAKFGYLSVRLECTSRIFTNFLKNFNSSCVHILSCGEDTLSVHVPILVHLPIRGGDDLWTNWPFLKKVFILWCRWQFFVSLRARNTLSKHKWRYKLQNISMAVLLAPITTNYLQRIKQITLASQCLSLLGFFPIYNNIFLIIDQCSYFLEDPIPKLSLGNKYIEDPKREHGAKQKHY